MEDGAKPRPETKPRSKLILDKKQTEKLAKYLALQNWRCQQELVLKKHECILFYAKSKNYTFNLKTCRFVALKNHQNTQRTRRVQEYHLAIKQYLPPMFE
ncbi:MAG: hypothetical protein M2R45_01355 [Verrucomicrobia subdivision 3 bacterium]|nr:hypothetical protein [Limisphaerales bacterium]MCS1416026.1 hypothetical protein [Limisphaerales bacterium]